MTHAAASTSSGAIACPRRCLSAGGTRRWLVGLVLVASGCASAVTPASADAVAPADADACDATLTCFVLEQGTMALPVVKGCHRDDECVVRSFRSDSTGTLEIVGLSTRGAADFDRASSACGALAGPPPGPTFFEADGGTVALGQDAAAMAVCHGGCCLATPAGP